MLLNLLRTHLRPYTGPLLIVVLFQLIATIANLYLPALNAEIIDDGVAKGDTAFIVSTGGVMLGITVLQIVCTIVAVFFGARTAMAFGRDLRAALFHQVGSFSDREVALCLSRALRAGAAAAPEGPSAIRRAARAVLVAEPLVLVDYLVLVHPTSLRDVPEWYRGEALLAVAGRVGTTRLIDNSPVLVGPGGGALEVFSNPDAAPEAGMP